MRKALLIIDMQEMPFQWKKYGGKTLYLEEKLIANTNNLITKARKNNSPVIYIMFTELEGALRSVNQPLWQILDQIAPGSQDHLIIKHHADSFLETELNTLLRQKNIDTLIMCGVQTEYCVDATVKSGFSHGYKVELAGDCHSTFDSDELTAEQIVRQHNTILNQFATIVSSNEILF